MARPKKNKLDYFPHMAKSGRSLFIIESRFGNNGYAVWFKLLELLCESENQIYDCSNVDDWEFFLAKTKIDEDLAEKILNKMADLGMIDKELWFEDKMIFSQNLVNNVAEVYKKRNVEIPKIDSFRSGNVGCNVVSDIKNPSCSVVSDVENTQSKVKYSKSKVNKSKVKVKYSKDNLENYEDSTLLFTPPTFNEIKEYCEQNGISTDYSRFFAYNEKNGWKIHDKQMTDWRPVLLKWAESVPAVKQHEPEWYEEYRRESEKLLQGSNHDLKDEEIKKIFEEVDI